MADPTTTNILLAVPSHGSDVDTWDQPLNANSGAIDGYFGGVQILGVAGSPITLTSPTGSATPSPGPFQAQNAILRFINTMTANVQVTFPLPGYYIVENSTSGNFVLSFRAAGSGAVVAVAQGSTRHLYNDGTNVYFANLPDVGTYIDYAGASVPAWISACTVPPYLNCDGSTFSSSTYPALYGVLGTNVLPDIRGTSRAALNQGTSRITSAGSGINGDVRFSRGGNELIQSHLHGINFNSQSMSQHPVIAPTLSLSQYNVSYGSGGGQIWGFSNSGVPTSVFTDNTPIDHYHPIVGNTSTVGSGSSQNMPPTTIHGITMIRAA